MPRVLRQYKRSRGENLDRAEGHVSHVADGSADDVESPTAAGLGHWRPVALIRRRSGGVLFELRLELRLGDGSDDLIHELSVLEEKDRRN